MTWHGISREAGSVWYLLCEQARTCAADKMNLYRSIMFYRYLLASHLKCHWRSSHVAGGGGWPKAGTPHMVLDWGLRCSCRCSGVVLCSSVDAPGSFVIHARIAKHHQILTSALFVAALIVVAIFPSFDRRTTGRASHRISVLLMLRSSE